MFGGLALRLVGAGLLVIFGFLGGWKVQAWRHDAAEAKQLVRIVKVVELRGQQNTQLIAAHVAERERIRFVYRDLVKEVPTYVTPAADAACPVPVGFVRVHDAAAAGVPPTGPGADGADDAASGIALSAVGQTVAGNYGTCREWRQQLLSLQAFEHDRAVAAHVK